MSKIVELMPVLNEIKCESLRDKTIACWEAALEQGGWEAEELKKMPFTLLIPDTKVTLLQHTLAVTETALRIAPVLVQNYNEYYTIDMDAVISGGLLHDVGKVLEYRKTEKGYTKSDNGILLRHPFSGAGLATKCGLPDKIVHMIAVHAKEGNGGYRCPEAVIVHHADFINFEPLRDLLK